ncbi:MAG TPA: VOC family protein [Acetobacteraceae bacterium]|jgi:catechol 2,3-dioxygenase-like lactoylglutathione lyase family enzyme|nr:VOC family protein [Acetobacteraceae bacterium]
MMLDHVSLCVLNLDRSRAFYAAALAPLDIAILFEDSSAVGFGKNRRPRFWLNAGGTPSGPTHIAFIAVTRADVRAFHAAALAAGGTDNGAPGLRPQYHADYYGAFVLDPDGNNAEAVCRNAEA